MPLIKGSSKGTVSKNISEMMHSGYPQKQAIAAALNVARQARSKHATDGGVKMPDVNDLPEDLLRFAPSPKRLPHVNSPNVDKAFWIEDRKKRESGGETTKQHVGAIHSVVAGRTDHLPMNVPSGSYVIPADIISAMGEGNTMAGFRVAKEIFGDTHDGGVGDDSFPSVPIVAAGGEYVVHPDDVRNLGGGDLDEGHKILDSFVKKMRAKTVQTLRNLPGPKKD